MGVRRSCCREFLSNEPPSLGEGLGSRANLTVAQWRLLLMANGVTTLADLSLYAPELAELDVVGNPPETRIDRAGEWLERFHGGSFLARRRHRRVQVLVHGRRC